jgi:predicted outer membrane repeat protein
MVSVSGFAPLVACSAFVAAAHAAHMDYAIGGFAAIATKDLIMEAIFGRVTAILFASSLLFGCGGGGGGSSSGSGGGTATVPVTPPLCTHASTADGVLVTNVAELQAALTNAGGNGRDDVIYIAAGLYKPEQTLVYDAKGTTEKISLVGCASDDVVIDGQSKIRIFHFQKNGRIGDISAWRNSTIHNPPYPALRLQGLTVKNGDSINDTNQYGYSGGGMLVERYNTELNQIRVLNNRDAYEGAGVNGVADVSIKDSVFQNNANTSFSGGGAISACGAVTITNSTFDSNSRLAVYRGICIEADYSRLPITIHNSVFKRNQTAVYALGDYGASNGSLGQMTVSNSRFEENRGSALVSRVGNLTITNTRFVSNGFQTSDTSNAVNCVDYDFFPCGSGGALLVDNYITGGGVVSITGSEFSNNYAPNYGGAIAMGGVRDCQVTYSREGTPCNPVVSGFDPEYNIVLRDTTFTGNRSHRGAAIAIARMPLARSGFQRGSITIDGGSFRDNVAELITPAAGITPVDELQTTIIGTGGVVRACGTTFSNNRADAVVAGKGGSTGC